MKERISQRDIARELGVDTSTVSLALRRHPRISAATVQRVLAAAERLGYRPDPALATIASSRWQGRRSVAGTMLGFLVDSRSDTEAELRLYEQGIRLQAGLLGYGVSTFYLDEYPSPAAFWRVIRTRGIRGVLVGQSRQPLEDALLSETVAPVVHCGFLREVRADTVCPDLRLAAKTACAKVQEKYDRVTCFLPIEKDLVSDHTLLGAIAAARAGLGGKPPALVIAKEIPSPADFKRLVKTRPQAVIVINRLQADNLKKNWPATYALPAIYTLHTLPPFSGIGGIDLRLESIGRVAVNLLEMKMRHLPLASASFRQTLLVEPRWLEAKC